MEKITVELVDEQVASIVIQELLDSYNYLQDELAKVQGGENRWVFDTNREADELAIKEHIKHFTKVLAWFGHHTKDDEND